MDFVKTKWKDCILVVTTLIVTSQIKPVGLIHTYSRSHVHCYPLVGRCGGEATAAVGDWEWERTGGCIGVGGMCSPGDTAVIG